MVAAGNLGISRGHMSIKQSARAGCVVYHSRRFGKKGIVSNQQLLFRKKSSSTTTDIVGKKIFMHKFAYIEAKEENQHLRRDSNPQSSA